MNSNEKILISFKLFLIMLIPPKSFPKVQANSLFESVWSVCFEHSSVSALARSIGCSKYWELKAVFSEQVRSWSSDFVL